VLDQVVAEFSGPGLEEARPERLERVQHAREDAPDRLGVVAGRERGGDLVGGLDGGTGDAALAIDFAVDERLAVRDELRLDFGSEHLLQRGHEGSSP
jgi:hypothetical protein